MIASLQEQLPSTVPLLHDQRTSTIRKRNPYQALVQHSTDGLCNVCSLLVRSNASLFLEEDLHISSDFSTYFQAMAPILDNDSSLLAVSAFYDIGCAGRVLDSSRVVRSDLFPGLGWMLYQNGPRATGTIGSVNRRNERSDTCCGPKLVVPSFIWSPPGREW